LGSEAFKARLLEQMEGRLGNHHSGALRHESTAAKAERIIAAELKRRQWSETDLERRAKTHPEKLALSARLRRETTLTIREIAGRLWMGSWKSLSNQLYFMRKVKSKSSVRKHPKKGNVIV
jgi:hypothetical protein